MPRLANCARDCVPTFTITSMTLLIAAGVSCRDLAVIVSKVVEVLPT